ncbi:hypothetical protein N7467_002710 [Penicillium canescens]|nr:hypothetical protein N7467_002710 [Penicillium canescens]
MADPPTAGPEPFPTNTQEFIASIPGEELQATAAADRSGLLSETRKRTRSGDAFAPSDPAGRITTKEVWKLIGTLKDVIRHQTAAIATTQNKLKEIKHNQNVLQEQNENLYKEAIVVANGGNSTSPLNHQKPEKEQNCVRISTQRTFVDLRDNINNDGNTFGRYLPIEAANTIGTTKTGYIIRFKNTESANVARNNTEWLYNLGNNTKLVKPRFSVVIHRTPTEEFDLETGPA